MVAEDLDQFKGVLLGCAVGDALGAPVEGWSSTEISLVHGGPVRNFLPERYGPGAFTDDTQLTLALAEALVARGTSIWTRLPTRSGSGCASEMQGCGRLGALTGIPQRPAGDSTMACLGN